MKLSMWKLSYGVGHVLNDVAGILGISYHLLFLQRVLRLPYSSTVLCVGQVADGIATIAVGYLADREIPHFLSKYQKLKIWHLFGSFTVAIPFLLFHFPSVIPDSIRHLQFGWYLTMSILFQIGFAAVQISHLSLIPVLASSSAERAQIGSLRYAFTGLTNLVVSFASVFVFGSLSIQSGSDSNPPVADYSTANHSSSYVLDKVEFGPEDKGKFQIIVSLGVLIGVLATIFFQVFTREPSSSSKSKKANSVHDTDNTSSEKTSCDNSRDGMKFWLLRIDFWILAISNASTRLYITISMVYVAYYLSESLRCTKLLTSIAPSMMYVGAFSSTGLMKKLTKLLGCRRLVIVVSAVGLLASLVIRIGEGYIFSHYLVFPLLVVVGGVGGIFVVTNVNMTSDIVSGSSCSAFVYGTICFINKLSFGVAVELIENFVVCQEDFHRDGDNAESCSGVYRYILVSAGVLTCGINLLLALFYKADSLWNPDRVEKHFETIESECGGVVDANGKIKDDDSKETITHASHKRYSVSFLDENGGPPSNLSEQFGPQTKTKSRRATICSQLVSKHDDLSNFRKKITPGSDMGRPNLSPQGPSALRTPRSSIRSRRRSSVQIAALGAGAIPVPPHLLPDLEDDEELPNCRARKPSIFSIVYQQ